MVQSPHTTEERMMQTDDQTRRKLDAELRLQADPVLRECVEALVSVSHLIGKGAIRGDGGPSRIMQAQTIIRAALARARGEAR